MFVTSEIQGQGNALQQDRVGSSVKISTDGTQAQLMWVADGHGRRMGQVRYDLGGLAAQVANDALASLGAHDIQRLYRDVEFGKELYANIQFEIELAKDEFLFSKGWRKVIDDFGDAIDALWTRAGVNTVTSSGGTTLILVAALMDDGVWKGRMYNVGDSMMVFKDTVYSQPGLDGLTDAAVKGLVLNNMRTIYSTAPGAVRHDAPFHVISEDGSVSIKSPPSPIGGRHLHYLSTVRGDIAMGITLTATPEMFNLKKLDKNGRRPRFSLLTGLASWSNMGDTQNPVWSSVPSYSNQFVIDGPLSLTSDGIGDILKCEVSESAVDKSGWFNFYEDHPMHGHSDEKDCTFKNSWFHKTVLETCDGEAPSWRDDPFYKIAKATFGVPDNISRVTFIP